MVRGVFWLDQPVKQALRTKIDLKERLEVMAEPRHEVVDWSSRATKLAIKKTYDTLKLIFYLTGNDPYGA